MSEAARALRALFLNIVGDTKTEIDEGVTWTTGEIAGLRDILMKYAPEAYAAAAATNSIVDPMQAIGGLAQAMKEGVLTEQELMTMVSDIGGKLRTSQLLALIENWDMYESMLTDYQNAAGTADKEIGIYMDSWEARSNKLKNTWVEFVKKFLNTKIFKDFISVLTWIIQGLGNLGNALLIIGGIITAFKINTWITNLKLISGAVSQMGGGLKNLISVLRIFGTAQAAAQKNGDALTASTLAEKAAIDATTASVSVLSIALGALTVAYTIYTIAKNKQAEADRKAAEEAERRTQEARQASYAAAQTAIESNDQVLSSLVTAEKSANIYNDALNTLADTLSDTIPLAADNTIQTLKELADAENDATLATLQKNAVDISAAKFTAGTALFEAAEKNPIVAKTAGKTEWSGPFTATVTGSTDYWDAYGKYGVGALPFVTDVNDRYAMQLDPLLQSLYSDQNFGPNAQERNPMVPLTDNDVANAMAYRETVMDTVELMRQWAYETGNNAILDSELYKGLNAYLDETEESYQKYIELSDEALNSEAVIQFASDLMTASITSQEAFDAYIESVQNSTEYSDEMKEALIALAEKYFPQYTRAVETNTTAIDYNTSATEKAAAAQKEAEAAARKLIPVLFDENNKLTDVGKSALYADSALAGMVKSELEAQLAARQANYTTLIAQLAQAGGMAAYARAELEAMGQLTGDPILDAAKIAAMQVKLATEKMRIVADIASLQSQIAQVSAYIPSTGGGSSGGSHSGSSGSSSSSSVADARLTALQDRIKLLKSELSLMQEAGESEEDQIAKMREIQDALHNEAEYLRSIGGDQVTINNLSQEWWSYHNKIEKLMEQEANDAQKQAEAIQKAVDAQLALNNALNNRNVRVYNAQTGQWEWMANPSNVESALKAYNDAVSGFSASDMTAYKAALAKAMQERSALTGAESYAQTVMPLLQALGAVHNGNNYNFAGLTFTEAQARTLTLYDLAQMARNLALAT